MALPLTFNLPWASQYKITLSQSNLPPSSFKLKNKGTGDEFAAGKMNATEPRNTSNTVWNVSNVYAS